MRTLRRAVGLVLAVWILGFGLLLVEPAYAAAKAAIQDVFITNTPENPIPVAPQGTTQIAGTVTVANPPAAASEPVLVQKAFETQPITREQPFTSGTLYEVPAGKLLTVDYFQAHWIFSGVGLRQASLRAGKCPLFQPTGDPNVDRLQVFFPDQNAGLGYHVVGGAVSLVVPAGSCLTYEVGAVNTDIQEGSTLFVYGGFTGRLTDAPAAA